MRKSICMRATARCSCVSSLSAQQTVHDVGSEAVDKSLEGEAASCLDAEDGSDARRGLLSRWQLPAGSVMS